MPLVGVIFIKNIFYPGGKASPVDEKALLLAFGLASARKQVGGEEAFGKARPRRRHATCRT